MIVLIGLVALCAGGALFFVAKARSETSTKPNQSDQAKTTNTYQQNIQVGNSSSTNNSTNTPTQNLEKPKLTIGATTAPNNVPIDITCWGVEGNYCQISIKNQKTNQVINLNQATIITDKANQSTAHWAWTTQTGTWQVTATTTDKNNKSASSETQTIEVK